jgi:hypothetical protein
MAENHMKYMPHHPKPKFADTGTTPNMLDTSLRSRPEPTGHDGSMDAPTNYENFHDVKWSGMQWQ